MTTMRSIIDLIGRVQSVPTLSETVQFAQQVLNEFRAPSGTPFKQLVGMLSSKLQLQQIGGPSRIYDVSEGEGNRSGAMFMVGNTDKAVGIAWERGTSEASAIYVWLKYDPDGSADFALDLGGNQIDTCLPQIINFIQSPREGALGGDENAAPAQAPAPASNAQPAAAPAAQAAPAQSQAAPARELAPANESYQLDEAKQISGDDFKKLAMSMFGDKAASLSLADLMKISDKNDVKIPGSIRADRSLKVDAHHWNLTGEEGGATNKKLGSALGGEVEQTTADAGEEFSPAIELARAKTLRRLADTNKVYLMGRKANGAFFRVPGMEELCARLERMLANELGKDSNLPSMDQQYETLKSKVELVAGGKSAYIKSLLITGAPSSGKTFNVMQTIKQLGLQAGKDYIVKKGRITVVSLLRTLIEQIEGMVIFDDCDSVVEDKNGVNMLKGALDTEPVRQIDYDVRGTLNTAVMDDDRRVALVNAMSRVLRGKPEEGDLDKFKMYMKVKKKKDDDDDDSDLDELPSDEDLDAEAAQNLHEVQEFVTKHLPNKIDFQGRIIFISNMDETEWDSAIITRAFTQNMSFSDIEMLDFIDKIKGSMPTPNVSDEEKQEVMDYLRQLWEGGRIRRAINFRLVQQCFDLRLTTNWRMIMAQL